MNAEKRMCTKTQGRPYMWLNQTRTTVPVSCDVDKNMGTSLYRSRYCPLVISGYRRDAEEICALLGCYAAPGGNSIPTLRHNLSVPSSKVKKSHKNPLLEPWRWDRQVIPKHRYGIYRSTLRNILEKSVDMLSTARVVMKAVLLRKSGDENNPELRRNVNVWASSDGGHYDQGLLLHRSYPALPPHAHTHTHTQKHTHTQTHTHTNTHTIFETGHKIYSRYGGRKSLT